MIEIPKDVAERLYELYAATVIDPISFDELMPCKNDIVTISDRVRAAYEKGIVIPGEQLFWIWHAHKKNADLSEPYDVGVLNALALAMYIFSDKEHGFWEKPRALRSVIDILDHKIKVLQERLLADQKNYADRLDEKAKNCAAEIVNSEMEIKELKDQLEKARSIPDQETVKEDDKP